MALRIRLLADLKRQKGSIIGIFLLVFFAALSLAVAVTVFYNSGSFIEQEMERVGYGTLTAWISGYPDIRELQTKIQEQDIVSHAEMQPLCYCKELVLQDCTMEQADLAFENSEVHAVVSGGIDSVKNPLRGEIHADSIGELILEEDRINPDDTKIICGQPVHKTECA